MHFAACFEISPAVALVMNASIDSF